MVLRKIKKNPFEIRQDKETSKWYWSKRRRWWSYAAESPALTFGSEVDGDMNPIPGFALDSYQQYKRLPLNISTWELLDYGAVFACFLLLLINW